MAFFSDPSGLFNNIDGKFGNSIVVTKESGKNEVGSGRENRTEEIRNNKRLDSEVRVNGGNVKYVFCKGETKCSN